MKRMKSLPKAEAPLEPKGGCTMELFCEYNQIPYFNIKYMTGFHKIIDMKLAETLSLISRTKHQKFSNTLKLS